jgi:hypothetical protein
MEPERLQQVRGGVELAADTIEAVARRTAETHHDLARRVYAPFDLRGRAAAPVHAIERSQAVITGLVYQAILGTNRAVALGAVALLERLSARAR